jgi:hypothetical protein
MYFEWFSFVLLTLVVAAKNMSFIVVEYIHFDWIIFEHEKSRLGLATRLVFFLCVDVSILECRLITDQLSLKKLHTEASVWVKH